MMKQENEDEIEMINNGGVGSGGGSGGSGVVGGGTASSAVGDGGEGGGNVVVEEQMIPKKEAVEDTPAKKRTIRKNTPNRDGIKRKARRKKDENALSVIIKYSALFLLVAQMVGLVLLMRYSRTQQGDGPLYLASTAVFVMEVMKLIICCCVIAYQSGGRLGTELQKHVIQAPMEIAKLCVPSFLYTIQNNLLYLALSNLDAATYQVCYQLKILTTALFSVVLLQRKFSMTKWLSLVLLTIGVAIVQVSGKSNSSNDNDEENNNRFIGLIAVLCAACTSGFSGVYFEMILKGSKTSLWLRNVQMGIPSVIIAYLTVYVKDSSIVAENGFLGGYTSIVWTVVTVQAVGGLIVAVVVKYADNVLKVFATSFSIVISCVISAIFFDFHATFSFIVGASLVVVATVMYSKPERKKVRRKPVLPMTTGSSGRNK